MKLNEQRLYLRTRERLDAAAIVDDTRLTETDAVELARAIVQA
jgi:hypothetical protein